MIKLITAIPWPQLSTKWLLRVSVALKIHNGHSNFYKGNYLIETSLQVQSVVHYHHGKTHGQVQVDKVLDNTAKDINQDEQAARRERQWACP